MQSAYVLNDNNNSPYIIWTVTVRSNPNTGNTTIVIQLSAHCEQKWYYIKISVGTIQFFLKLNRNLKTLQMVNIRLVERI